jgi:hypothetical protein
MWHAAKCRKLSSASICQPLAAHKGAIVIRLNYNQSYVREGLNTK